MTELLASTTPSVGYTIKAVAARIADMDIDADGNGEKAAWKRYLSLCLLALAKGVEKKTIVEMVFGKGGKASKTFHNMWTMANKCRGHVTGNLDWPTIAGMGVQEAFDATVAMINRHMAVHNVAGKNAYDDVCNMSVEEVATAKAAKAAADVDAKAAADAAAAKEAEDKAAAEKAAKTKAAEQPERTAAQAAIAALHGASKADLSNVMQFIMSQLAVDEIKFIRDECEHIISNAAKTADVKEETKPKGKGRALKVING